MKSIIALVAQIVLLVMIKILSVALKNIKLHWCLLSLCTSPHGYEQCNLNDLILSARLYSLTTLFYVYYNLIMLIYNIQLYSITAYNLIINRMQNMHSFGTPNFLSFSYYLTCILYWEKKSVLNSSTGIFSCYPDS